MIPNKLAEIQRIRDSVPLPATIGELYTAEGKFRTEFNMHGPAERAVQRYHKRTGEAVYSSNGRLPVGLEQALHLPLVWVQIVNRYPWKVMWVRTVNGQRKKGEQLCSSLGGAIIVQRKVARIVPNATVVSRTRGYDIPPQLRGKLPPRWYWCPRCMKPRRYQRDPDDATFYVVKKQWSDEKQRYVWKERRVYVLRCPMCNCTNRDPVFRRSNQPWEVKRYKRGATRASNRKSRRHRRSG
jgi:hypothetical protein